MQGLWLRAAVAAACLPGTPLYANGGEHGVFHLMVVELTVNGAILDGNHPLAGKTLHFDVEVLEVEAAA